MFAVQLLLPGEVRFTSKGGPCTPWCGLFFETNVRYICIYIYICMVTRGVWWASSPCGVGFGGVEFVLGIRCPSRVGSPADRAPNFCGRRFCSETLGCPFRCFGRPRRFLLGTIQYRAITSVLMTSRPQIIDYTLCHVLYTIYSRVYTIYCRLYSVYMVYLYTIARPLKGGNQVLHTSLTTAYYSIV